MSHNLKTEKFQCVKDIVEKDPPKYGYLPIFTELVNDWRTFPNQFYIFLRDKIVQFGEYHPEVIKDNKLWGSKYQQFQQIYARNQQQLLTSYQQQQLMYANYYQQTQAQYTQQQQAYNQYYQNPQQYQQPYQQQYGQQQYYQQNYGQPQQQFGQQNYTGHRQHRPHQQQNNVVEQEQVGQTQTQHGNYRREQYQNQQNQGNKPRTNYNKYQQQTPGNIQNVQNDGQKQNWQHQPHHGYQNRQRNQQYNQYYQQHQNQQFVQQAEYQPQQHKYQEKVQQAIVVEPPQPPPKPQPKPMKFSLKQIRDFISEFGYEEKQNVSESIIQKATEVQAWRKGEESFQQKPQKQQQGPNKFEKKQSTRGDRGERGDRGQRGDRDGGNQQFNKGANYRPTPPPDLVKKVTGLRIEVGKNQTLQTKMIKIQIKQKAGLDFATLIQKQNLTLDEVQKAKKQIIFNLNLLAPENLKDIQKDLLQYLFANKDVCEVLIQQIIEKAWSQPKYASTYARLCSQFSKYPVSDFKFDVKKQTKKEKDKKQNPFKVFLISTVQHSFDKKDEDIPVFTNDEQKENWLKESKKKILGNVKFIAQLIRSKILKKKIIKICLSQLLFTFLSKYYYFRKDAKLIDSYYDYYFDALIEFIQNLGDAFDKMDEGIKITDDNTDLLTIAQKKIIELIEMTQQPPEQQINQITNLKADDYFKLFSLIDEKVLRKTNSRLSALLLNLTERRSNNWQKHHAEADGPKKLKDIKEDIAREEQEMNKVKSQKKANLQLLHQKVKVMFKDWQSQAKNEKTHFKNIIKQFSESEFYIAFLKQVADEKKEVVRKRIDLFDILLENYNTKVFRQSWLNCIKDMAFDSGDYPFIGSALALILKRVLQKEGNNKLKDYFTTFEDEDEQFFMEEVYGRLYHYTQIEQIKQLTTPNKKYSNMYDN